MINDIDQLDTLNDDQIWEVAADMNNAATIRQEAIQRWLFPDETDPDADADDLSGGRFRELQQRATVISNDEFAEDDIEDIEEMSPYFDRQGRLLLAHNGMQYLIDSLDEGEYDGINTKDDVYTTDDKNNLDSDL